MVPHRSTRREVLGLTGVALAGLAGCTTLVGDADSRNTASPTASEPSYAHSEDAVESVSVRTPTGDPAVRSAARSPGEDQFESGASWAYENWLVTTDGERDALEFAGAVDGVDTAREFVAATDLSETTLLVHQYNVDECATRRLDRLKWGDDFSCGDVDCVGIFLHYDRAERDGDCRGDDAASDGPPYGEGSYASEATFVRIPARIESYGRFSVQV